ncbi:MAG: YicC family protein [Lachnospiraceae bacterium]|nr:YicC family protein [Lachnospiraceae bacterium]
MIKSMTGFGHSERESRDYKISAEIKSVNHRYCDLNIKLPKKFNAYENDIRNIVKKYAARGKIDVYISYENYSEAKTIVKYNSGVAKGYMDAIIKASEEFSIEPSITSSLLVRFPDVISLEDEEIDSDEIFKALAYVVEEACKNFLESREREGSHLYKDINDKLDYINGIVEEIEKRSPEIIKEYRTKIENKVAELLGDTKIDESVLATEITIFADKVCVDEETVRLHSHINSMRETLSKDEPIGRKLDFISQELNRESNTILSKANDVEVSSKAIDLKTEIEKIREQIQNIE